jgi:low molecular weight protein-tyrosine phosphatase
MADSGSDRRGDAQAGAGRARLLFVCLGNICRSPMAEAVLRDMVWRAGLADRIEADSAGTRPYDEGGPAHPRTLALLLENGIDAAGLRCRGVVDEDFRRFDRILAADRRILARLERMAPAAGFGAAKGAARVELLLPYGTSGELDLLDPFPDGDFPLVFARVLDACTGLLADVRRRELAGGA